MTNFEFLVLSYELPIQSKIENLKSKIKNR